MRNFIKNQRNFIILFTLWLIGGLILLLVFDKVSLQKIFNTWHTPLGDSIFKYITYLGDGSFIAILGILMLFRSFRSSIFVLSTYLFSGLIAQILKKAIFNDINRPNYVFNEIGQMLPKIEGVVLKNHYSFPSGHTTTAFALIFSLLILFGIKKTNYKQQVLFFIIALIIGFSRVYLNQHFFIDIYVGSIIGTLSCLPFFFWFRGINNNWFDKSIVQVLKPNNK